MAQRVAVGAVLLCFLVTNTFSGFAHAAEAGDLPYPAVSVYRDLSSDIRDGIFELPDSLGYVQDLFRGDMDRVVIHIRDAHCDYYSQRATNRILRYFREEYGVTLVCLEGGAGGYDLSPFTDIEDRNTRDKVADFFLRQGSLNAAEFASVKEPGRFLLWGVEDEGLYLENLAVYRGTAKYKQEADGYLELLGRLVDELKRHIYSEELLRMDEKYSAYKNNALSLKDYLSCLFEQAGLYAIPFRDLRNIYFLKHVLEEEEKIKFRTANAERNEFVEALRQKMPPAGRVELVKQALRFKSGELTEKQYYNYLMEEGKKAELNISDYPSLQSYIIYISLYTSIDKSRILAELAELEALLSEGMRPSDKQAELMRLSRNFSITRKAFGFSMTKDDLDYLREQAADFTVSDIISFIEKEAPLYKIRVAIPKEAARLDDWMKEIEKFYDYSFERDEVFVDRTGEKMEASGYHNAVLITGGFHAENLAELLRNEGFSYVSIQPRFKDKKGYESPYFKILAGGYPELGRMITGAISAATSMLQVASIWNHLGLEVAGEKGGNLAMIQLEMVKKLKSGKKAILAIEDEDFVLEFSMNRKGRIDYELVPQKKISSGDRLIPDVMINNIDSLSYEDHDKIIDKTIQWAYENGWIKKVNPADPNDPGASVINNVARFFKDIGHKQIAKAIKNGDIPIHRIEKGINGLFDGHASWRGIYFRTNEMNADLQADVIVHEIGAYYRLGHDLNAELEDLHIKYRMRGEKAIQTVDLKKFERLKKINALADPGAVKGRDHADSGKEKPSRAPKGQFLKNAGVDGGYLVCAETGKKARLISFGGKIATGAMEAIRAGSEAIPFVDAETIAGFLDGWDVLTIEDNYYTAGFVDAKSKKLYISEMIRASANTAPEIIPIIILSEICRFNRLSKDIAAELGLKSDTDPAVLLRGLSGAQRKVLADQLAKTSGGKKAFSLSSLRGFSDDELRLIEANQNRFKERERLGYGLLDQLFGAGAHEELMKAVRDLNPSHDRTVARFAEAMIRMRPRSWVVFADVVGGRAREKSMGSKIMDRLSPEAAKVILRVAREKGIFAYHFGLDEYAFVFPETYGQDDIKRFFLDLRDEMKKGSSHVLYEANTRELHGAIREKIKESNRRADKEQDERKRITVERIGRRTHILIPRELARDYGSDLKSVEAKEKDIHPFFLPAGGVRWTGDPAAIGFEKLLEEAEKRSGQKWREDEINKKTPKERSETWNALTTDQRNVIKQAAFSKLPRKKKKEYEKRENLSADEALRYGLPGLNKDMVLLDAISEKDISEGDASGKGSVLKDADKFAARKEQIRKNNRDTINKIVELGEGKGRKKKYHFGDDYTSYSARSMKDFLREIFDMSPEERMNLPADQRIFMVRGPPIDFYVVMINDDGTVTALDIDVMCHAENIEHPVSREEVKNELKRGLGGRATDYVVARPDIWERLGRGEITQEKFEKELEEGMRMFPFKALNSYVPHGIADDFILAANVAIYENFVEMFGSKEYGGKNSLDSEGIREAIRRAADAIHESIDGDEFRSITGKEPIDIFLEAHVVNARKDEITKEGARSMAEKCTDRINAMAAVRDPGKIRRTIVEGRIAGKFAGGNKDI